MKSLANLFNHDWWTFLWRYVRGRTPWDTGVTPPEVVDYIKSAPPGRALDLGCGTGTNAIAMTKQGWQVVGIDFISGAIRQARKKAACENVTVDFQVGDVTRLDPILGPFDYILDIGCLHSLASDQRQLYAEGVKRLIGSGGMYMLYAWMPRDWKGRKRGIAPETLTSLFTPPLRLEKKVVGEEGGGPSVWYWFIN